MFSDRRSIYAFILVNGVALHILLKQQRTTNNVSKLFTQVVRHYIVILRSAHPNCKKHFFYEPLDKAMETYGNNALF